MSRSQVRGTAGEKGWKKLVASLGGPAGLALAWGWAAQGLLVVGLRPVSVQGAKKKWFKLFH